jgi:alpha-1,3-mannosyltransferase
MHLGKQARDLTTKSEFSRTWSHGLLAVDSLLCLLILWKVPCMLTQVGSILSADTGKDTEIDWKAYMQQVQQFVDGKRDYVKIRGDTGPIVYPAGHLYVYTILFALTDGGKNIQLAQAIFTALYLLTLAVVMACYRLAQV